MCIAFFTLSQPGYKLILASNRDEFLARPTSPAHWHNFSPSPPNDVNGIKDDGEKEEGWVLSGIDKGAKNGGTWLGITRDLRVGLLTNVRLTPPTPPIKPSSNPPSRGLLLKDFLSPSPSSNFLSVHEYLTSHLPSSGEYEGFNLLLFNLSKPKAEVGYLTNRPIPNLTDLHIPSSYSHPTISSESHGENHQNGYENEHQLAAECFGISNSSMNEPWPKVIQGEERMGNALKDWKVNEENDKQLIERMFGVLSQSNPITKDIDMKSSTSIPLINFPSQTVKPKPLLDDKTTVHNPTIPVDKSTTQETESENKPRWYGTRTSTIIIIKDNGEAIFVERDILELDQDGNPRKGTGQRWVKFKAELNE